MNLKDKALETIEGLTFPDIEYLERLFEEQFGDLPVGGFILPELVEVTPTELTFRCHYLNYEMEEDVWYYSFNRETQQFYKS